MGDSAGGNLCMALMSHVLHPHPSPTIPPLTLPSPIRGMILVSPWIDLSVNRASVTTNKYKDYLWPVTAKLWASAWLGTPWPHTANTDRYNQAITAPQDWWNGLPADELLIVAGKDEVLIDGIVEFAETLKAVKGKDVQVVVAPGECHDFPAIEIYYDVKDTGLQTRVMRSWLAERM
jgi:acetyl esterase/lipase